MGVNLNPLAEVIFTRLLPRQVTLLFPLSILSSLERSHYTQPVLEWEVILYLLEGWVSTEILWNSSALFCLFFSCFFCLSNCLLSLYGLGRTPTISPTLGTENRWTGGWWRLFLWLKTEVVTACICLHKTLHRSVHSSIIQNSQRGKQPKCPSIDKWKSRMWYSYTMDYYSALKRNKVLVQATT